MTPRSRISAGLIGLIALVFLVWLGRDLFTGGSSGTPAGSTTPAAATSTVRGTTSTGAVATSAKPPADGDKALSELPAEAAKTWQLIERGGPFPYPDKDGTEFRNLEKRLPAKAKAYYREYTVPTPGERTRGARRLVTGQGSELYYTGDHYESFVKVDPKR